jgi:hypothetical protein
MFQHILVLLHQLLRTEVAVLVEQVDLEDLLAVGGVGIRKDVGHEEGENVAEGAVSDVDAEDVVVVGVEELDGGIGTKRPVIPPA